MSFINSLVPLSQENNWIMLKLEYLVFSLVVNVL